MPVVPYRASMLGYMITVLVSPVYTLHEWLVIGKEASSTPDKDSTLQLFVLYPQQHFTCVQHIPHTSNTLITIVA